MGQGQDKIAKNLLQLEPTAILEFFIIYPNTVDAPDIFFALHGGSNFQKPITWQNVPYLPMPIETEGFEVHANGRIARPKIRISNKDYFMSDALANNKDFKHARVIRKRTFVKYLDDENFDNDNPWNEADSSAELSSDTYIVGQKTAENKLYVEFELNSLLDIDNLNLNNRIVMSNYCSFPYRSYGCNYKGLPVADGENNNLSLSQRSQGAFANGDPSNTFTWKLGFAYVAGDIVATENKKTAPATKTYYVCKAGHTATALNAPWGKNSTVNWVKDECQKTINACKKRFNTDTYNKSVDYAFDINDNYVALTGINEFSNSRFDLFDESSFPQIFGGNFTVAMYIGATNETFGRRVTPYSLFTNVKSGETQPADAVNYYLYGGENGANIVAQQVRVQNTGNNTIQVKYLVPSNTIDITKNYNLVIFECFKPKAAGGYVKATLNDGTPVEITLNSNEVFTFSMPEFSHIRSSGFSMGINNFWGASNITNPYVTRVRFNSLMIWDRVLNDSEKKWLYRSNVEPNSSAESEVLGVPRRVDEITNQFRSITGNLICWHADNIGGYSSSTKDIFLYSDVIQNNGSQRRIKGSNILIDPRGTIKSSFKYTYTTKKEPDYYLPFGGFPATDKFSYGTSF
jgi:lambda family phage minor tail protein L